MIFFYFSVPKVINPYYSKNSALRNNSVFVVFINYHVSVVLTYHLDSRFTFEEVCQTSLFTCPTGSSSYVSELILWHPASSFSLNQLSATIHAVIHSKLLNLPLIIPPTSPLHLVNQSFPSWSRIVSIPISHLSLFVCMYAFPSTPFSQSIPR